MLTTKMYSTLKGFALRQTLSGLIFMFNVTQGSRGLEPWAQISERLRRSSVRSC
jgi:hypothetical protein